MKRPQAFSPLTREAARILGKRIRLGRLERRWTLQELADRVGVSRRTMSGVERGDLSVSLGTALEAAALAGVPLFDEDPDGLRRLEKDTDLRLALLPARARRRRTEDDDF